MAESAATAADERALLDAVEATSFAARPQPVLVRRLDRLSLATGVGAFLFGVVVSVGWFAGADGLSGLSRSLPSVKLTTALSIGGIGLALVLRGRPWPLSRLVGATITTLGIALAAGTLVEYALGVTVPFDNLFGLDEGAGPYPGRMSGLTATALLLIWVSLALIRRHVLAAQLLATLCLTVSTITLVGYGYGVRSPHEIGPFSAASLQSAIGLWLASAAVLLHRSGEGYMALITGNTAGGIIVRRQLPLVTLLPIVVGAGVVRAIDHGLVEGPAALAVFATTSAGGGALIAWIQAARLRRLDLRRAGAEEAFAIARDSLRARALLEDDLRRANSDLGDFSAAMAHDLRSPLTAIRGYAELLETEVGEGGRDMLGRIERAAERGAQLIGDILAFAQVGRHELRREPVDLGALVARVRDEALAGGPRAADVRIAALPRVSGDPVLLQVLLANLIGNALKYVPEDREVQVVVDAVTDQGTGSPVLRVADNGDPIPAADAERIFEMFQRGTSSGTTIGSGVGLAICRRVAELHDGRIWLESSPLGGARFCVLVSG